MADQILDGISLTI